MKSSDIQINDWVYLTGIAKYAMRVESIDQDHCYLDFDGNESDPFDGIYGDDGIAPIPLTEEMLLLNGFVKEDEDCFCYINENEKVGIDFFKNGRITSIEKPGCYGKIVIYDFPGPYWVHEFQHLLRICGLENMADDFKIKNET